MKKKVFSWRNYVRTVAGEFTKVSDFIEYINENASFLKKAVKKTPEQLINMGYEIKDEWFLDKEEKTRLGSLTFNNTPYDMFNKYPDLLKLLVDTNTGELRDSDFTVHENDTWDYVADELKDYDLISDNSYNRYIKLLDTLID